MDKKRIIYGLSVLVFNAICCAAPCLADTDEFDRPAFTDHSFTLNQATLNVEAGFQQAHQHKGDGHIETFSFPALLRYGVTKEFELRAEGDIASLTRSSSEQQSDSSDLTTDTAGFKYHFLPGRKISSAFKPRLDR